VLIGVRLTGRQKHRDEPACGARCRLEGIRAARIDQEMPASRNVERKRGIADTVGRDAA